MTNNLVLNPETCDNIISMMNSPDRGNWTLVDELLNHIDIETNLPYILILYKESKSELRKAIFSNQVIARLEKVCDLCQFTDYQQLTYSQIYNQIKSKKVSNESMEYFLLRFSNSLAELMVNWGYSFMTDFDLKLIPKNESSR